MSTSAATVTGMISPSPTTGKGPHNMVNILRKLVVNEISSVDKGAGENCRIMLWKRDDGDAPSSRERLPPRRGKLFWPLPRAKSFDEVMKERQTFDGDEDIDNAPSPSEPDTPEPNDLDDENVLPEKLEQMIATMIEASPSLTRQQAAHHLLHDRRGRALATHLSSIIGKRKDPSMPTTEQELVTFVKRSPADGMSRIAKFVLDNQPYPTYTEMELSASLMAFANLNKNEKTGESRYQAFERILKNAEDPFDPNHDIYRALNVVKGYPDPMDVEPQQVGGADVDVDRARKSYQQLMTMAAEIREQSPWLSVSQAFARVGEQNPELLSRTRGLTEQDLKGGKRPTASSPSGDALQR
jgi:hypothetical protein